MSSYAGIYVNGKEVFTYRNEVYPQIMYLFAEAEYAHLTGDDALPYASNWYVHGDEGEGVEVHVYRVTASVLRDRLEVLGFGKTLVRRVVESLVRQELNRKIAMLEHFSGPEHDEIRESIRQEAASLEHFDYSAWKRDVRQHLAAKREAPEPDWRNKGPLVLFEEADERVLLRVIVDEVADDAEVVLDITDLVDGGYLGEDEDADEDWPSTWDLGSGPPIIITEGSFDAYVLRNAIDVLKPHLTPYIKFLDYNVGNEGGAAAAVRMLRSFAAAGISNRLVALFDNDSAAYEAVMALAGSGLPSHFAVMHYPDLPLAQEYPTLGPQGNTTMNVNRLAGSIELYLGEDILRSQVGELMPVQWKGYMGKVRTYQGEIISKSAVQSAFLDKVKTAKANPSIVASQDWSGLQHIIDELIDTLSSLPKAASAGGTM